MLIERGAGRQQNGIGDEPVAGTLTRNEWHLLLYALHEVPVQLKVGVPLAAKINRIVAPQPAPSAREAAQ